MLRPVLVTMAAVLVLAPLAARAWWSDDGLVQVTPALPRAGDELRIESTFGHEGSAGESNVIVAVEGPVHARDRFGVPRKAEAAFVQTTAGNRTDQVRCMVLSGGLDLVRAEYVSPSHDATTQERAWAPVLSSLLPGHASRVEKAPLAAFWTGMCPAKSGLDGRTVSEGEIVDAESVGITEWTKVDGAPAIRSSFHGRPALDLPFDVEYDDVAVAMVARIVFTIADGLPGFAVVRSEGTIVRPPECGGSACDVPVLDWVSEIVGFQPGSGEPIAPVTGTRLPPVTPLAPLDEFDPLTLDDRAFGFPYPFAEALGAALADPAMTLRGFLADHPDAVLAIAEYDRRATAHDADLFDTDGQWVIAYSGGGASHAVVTARSVVARPAVGPPVKVTWNSEAIRMAWSAEPTPLDARAPSSAIARTASAEGLDPASVEHLVYWNALGHAALEIDPVSPAHAERSPPGEGVALNFDASSGGLEFVLTTDLRRAPTGVLPLVPPSGEPLGSMFSVDVAGPLLGPARGAGLAAGVALGALAVGVKLLAPLYTRVARDALLLNPARRAIFEHVRANPGARRAEIERVAGAGEGGTRHHLRHLVRARLLAETRSGGFACYYVPGDLPPVEAARAAVLRSRTVRRVLEHAEANPGATLRETAAALGVSAPSVHRNVVRLRRAGLWPGKPGPPPGEPRPADRKST